MTKIKQFKLELLFFMFSLYSYIINDIILLIQPLVESISLIQLLLKMHSSFMI